MSTQNQSELWKDRLGGLEKEPGRSCRGPAGTFIFKYSRKYMALQDSEMVLKQMNQLIMTPPSFPIDLYTLIPRKKYTRHLVTVTKQLRTQPLRRK